ncbi:unnamed protein product [Ophioblennius macclurei]
MEKLIFLLSLVAAGCGVSQSICTTRRCLAEMLMKKAFLSQPQYENCTEVITVPYLQYETLSVDTKNLILNAQLKAELVWTDPELAWNTTIYPYDQVVLPVAKAWTPEFVITNSLVTEIKHSSRDLRVLSNGTLHHEIRIKTQVTCEVNLFNYPFAADECPIVIENLATDGCGSQLQLQHLIPIKSSHGDWQTDDAVLMDFSNGLNYILVDLSIKPANPFITLLLPSILILLADVGSFALPLTGGERNSFKVTLVLSFTVFLNILSDQLPGDGQCSPIIRTHFCICLVLLVLSMLVSMLLTRVADEGFRFLFCCSKGSKTERSTRVNDDTKPDITVVQLTDSEQIETLRNVSKYLDGLDAKEKEAERDRDIANKLERIFFCVYLLCTVGYFIGMIFVMVKYKCVVNHFDFFADDEYYD